MDVGVPLQQVAARMHDGDHPGPQVLVAGGFGHELAHGLEGGLAEPAQKITVVEEVGPQHFRHAEGPQAMADLGKDLLAQEGAEYGGPLGGTGGAETPTLAREREQKLGPAVVAQAPGEACLEQTASPLADV